MGKLRRAAAALLLAALVFTGCSTRPAAPQTEAPAPVPAASAAPLPIDGAEAVEAALENMTLEEKVGQLFFVRADVLDPHAGGLTEMTVTAGAMLVRCGVGGVVLFEDNIESPAQLRELTAALQRASKTPLLIAADEEGGAVSRLANTPSLGLPRYPGAAAVGPGGTAAAEEMGRTIGQYLRDYGVAMDFAPVADVNTNPANPVIGPRAFSSDAAQAASLAGAMASGLRASGVIPVYKHFPGHGDTAEDSHFGLAVSSKTAEELRACEWLPYIRNDLTGCAVMVGHIALPAVTGDMTPASLSERVVTGYLRGELGFEGLVITDALAMGSITLAYSSGEAALAALRAGCDVLLMPASLLEGYETVLTAVRSGELPESRIDESVRRILTYKAAVGLL